MLRNSDPSAVLRYREDSNKTKQVNIGGVIKIMASVIAISYHSRCDQLYQLQL